MPDSHGRSKRTQADQNWSVLKQDQKTISNGCPSPRHGNPGSWCSLKLMRFPFGCWLAKQDAPHGWGHFAPHDFSKNALDGGFFAGAHAAPPIPKWYTSGTGRTKRDKRRQNFFTTSLVFGSGVQYHDKY